MTTIEEGYKCLCKRLSHFSSCLFHTNMYMLMKSHVKVNYKCTKIKISWHDWLTIPIKCDANVIQNSGDLYDEEIMILQEFSCIACSLDK